MKLLLLFLLGMAILGLATERLNRKMYATVFCAAVMTSAIYFFLQRFMT